MGKYLILIISFVFSLQSSAQVIKYKSYTDAKKGVSILYPENWMNTPIEGTIFFFKRPREEAMQTFAENLNLVIGPVDDLSLEEYAMIQPQKLEKFMNNYKQVSQKYLKINKRDFYEIIYTFKYDKKDLEAIYYVTIKDGKPYELTATATQATFKRFLPVFEKMANSFKIN